MKNKRLLGSLLLLLTAMIWGTGFVFQRSGMDSAEPMSFTAARMTLSAAAIGALALARAAARKKRGDEEKPRRGVLFGGVCCGVLLGAATLFQQAGIVTTTAGKAGFLTAMYILLVPVLSLVLQGKKSGALTWAAVALGVAGLYLLSLSGSLRLERGDALECVCALLFAGHILCCDHFARRGDPVAISAVQFAAAALVSALAALCFEQPSLEKLAPAWTAILYCGLVSGGIGYTLQMTAQRTTDPTVASLLMSLEAVFAVLGGALLLGERMSAREIAGCAVMFVAIVLVQLPTGKKRKETS